MNLFDSIIRGRLGPFVAAILAFCYLVASGFRGFGTSTLDWLEGSRALAEEFVNTPAAARQWSFESTSFLELFGALFYALIPAGYVEWTLFALSTLAGAAATAMVFVVARKIAGAIGGWMALFFMLTCAPWLGIFSRIDPTFVVVPVILAILLVWHAHRWKWWQRTGACAPLVATGVVLWPGTAVVVAVMLAVELLIAPGRRPADHPGLTDGPIFCVDRLAIPAVAFGLLCLYPLFWPAPIDGLGQYFLAAVDQPPAEFVFRGDAYPPARPPFYTGAAWLFEQLPLALVGALSAGILWSIAGLKSADRRLSVNCAVLAATLMIFPVVFRTPRPFGADFAVLTLAVGIPVASLLTCRFFSHALGRNAPSKKVRQVAIVTFLLAGLSILIEVPRAIESPESFRSPMSARLTGWSASGDMPMRESILPLRLIENSGADRNTPLYTGGWERHVEVYRRMGLFDDIATTSSPDSAALAIRPVPSISADRFSSYPAHHFSAFDGAQTIVVPDIHRPLFFIDRKHPDQN